MDISSIKNKDNLQNALNNIKTCDDLKKILELEKIFGNIDLHLKDSKGTEILLKKSAINNNIELFKMIMKLESTRGKYNFCDNFILGNSYFISRVVDSCSVEFMDLVLSYYNDNTHGNKYNPHIEDGKITNYQIHALFTSCVNNNIDIMKKIKLLLSYEKKLGKFDFHFNNELIIVFVAENNDFEMLKYLISLEETRGKFDLHINNNIIIQWVVKNNNIEILKYLISLEETHGKFDLHINNDIIIAWTT